MHLSAPWEMGLFLLDVLVAAQDTLCYGTFFSLVIDLVLFRLALHASLYFK